MSLFGQHITRGVLNAGVAALLSALASVAAFGQGYSQVNLVSSEAPLAPTHDKQLRNPWGLAFSATSPFWAADNADALLTLYNGAGVKQGLVVSVAGAGGEPGDPSGQVFNGDSSAFMVSQNGVSGSAAFIVDGEDGSISGWSFGVDKSSTIVMVDNSKVGLGAVYKGLELVTTANGPVLLATNFRAGTIEEYDSTFTLIHTFKDLRAPTNYAPYNIRNLNGTIYVTFARQDKSKHDSQSGNMFGFIETLDLNTGKFTDFANRDWLNAPWGLALAPSNFGRFSNDLLVGNFGSGWIGAYDPSNGTFLGFVSDSGGYPITIPQLWSLDFGNGNSTSPTNWLYFSAGIDKQIKGLFGYLVANSGA